MDDKKAVLEAAILVENAIKEPLEKLKKDNPIKYVTVTTIMLCHACLMLDRPKGKTITKLARNVLDQSIAEQTGMKRERVSEVVNTMDADAIVDAVHGHLKVATDLEASLSGYCTVSINMGLQTLEILSTGTTQEEPYKQLASVVSDLVV